MTVYIVVKNDEVFGVGKTEQAANELIYVDKHTGYQRSCFDEYYVLDMEVSE